MIPTEPATTFEVEPIELDLPTLLPPRSRGKDRARFVASLMLGVLLHATLLWLLERHPSEDMPPVEEAIPVEIIMEPPPEPQPQPEPQPEQAPVPEQDKPQQKIYEEPATDAPRASDADGKGKQTQDQPAPQPQQPKPVEEPVKQPPQPTDLWGLQTPMPQFEFDAPAPKSKLPRGKADNTYLSRVYALVMQNLHIPNRDVPIGREVKIDFGVDSSGHIFQAVLIGSCGDREIDSAALDAVRKASPLPPPPMGGPVYLNFRFQGR